MIWHWLVTGWRSLIANPLFSLITVASLSVGCCGALLAGANIRQHLSFERWVPDAERVYLLQLGQPDWASQSEAPSGPVRPIPIIVPALKDAIEGRVRGMEAQTRAYYALNIIDFSDTASGAPDLDPPKTIYVDSNFFDFFDFTFVEGNADTAFVHPEDIVLTESTARRLFGNEQAVGQTIQGINRTRIFRIGGVIRDPPAETHLDFGLVGHERDLPSLIVDPLAPRPVNPWNNLHQAQHYVRMAEGTEFEPFQAGLIDTATAAAKGTAFEFFMSQNRFSFLLTPLLSIHLADPSTAAIGSSANMTLMVAMASAAAALLAVSCFNYVTLSLARSVRRQREVAMRKVLGASRGAVMSHYLAESALVTAISLAIGFALAQLLYPWFARAIGQPEALFNLFDPVFVLGAVAFFAVLAILVGVYPAFYLARVRPRGGLAAGEAASGGAAAIVSRGLLGLQIVAATILLVVALSMGAQAQFIANQPLGYSIDDLFQVNVTCRVPKDEKSVPQYQQLCERRRMEIARTLYGPDNVSATDQYGFFVVPLLSPATRIGSEHEIAQVESVGVDPGLLSFMKAELLAGRLFDPQSARDMGRGGRLFERRNEQLPVVVTRALLPKLNASTPEAAIGQTLALKAFDKMRFEIVGVISDWRRSSLREAANPVVFVPGFARTPVPVVRIPGGDEAVETIKFRNAWGEAMGRNEPATRLLSLRSQYEDTFASDLRMTWAVSSFAAVSILVACLGVFGLSSFDMQRRIREIGIKRALGATPLRISGVILGRQVLLAGAASLLVWPFAWRLADDWLREFTVRTQLQAVVLPLASLIIVAFVALAVGFTTIRAASIQPGAALRTAT